MHDLIRVFPGRCDSDWLVGCQELLFISLAKVLRSPLKDIQNVSVLCIEILPKKGLKPHTSTFRMVNFLKSYMCYNVHCRVCRCRERCLFYDLMIKLLSFPGVMRLSVGFSVSANPSPKIRFITGLQIYQIYQTKAEWLLKLSVVRTEELQLTQSALTSRFSLLNSSQLRL